MRRVTLVLVIPLLLALTPPPSASPHGGNWRSYVLAPKSRQVAPAAVLGADATEHARAALRPGGRSARLQRRLLAGADRWPAGTAADASSVRDDNHTAAAAIDGSPDTAWVDGTPDAYPDTLTVTAPEPVTLPGVTVESSTDGYPVDFTVETWDGDRWATQARVTGNDRLARAVRFRAPVSTARVRVTVTKDWVYPDFPIHGRELSRLTELVPGLVSDPYIDLDFGKVVAGQLEIGFAGASDPAPGVRVATSETRAILGPRSDYSHSDYGPDETDGGGDEGPGTDQHVPAPGGEVWVDRKGCQFGENVCSDGIRGFRYARVYLGTAQGDAAFAARYGQVDIDYVRLNFTSFLGTPDTYRGHFLSSDDLLNRAWYASVYTTELTTTVFDRDDTDPRGCDTPTLQGKVVYHDGAKRDRCPYGGGMDVAMIATYLSHPDPNPMRNVIADFGDHQFPNGEIPGSQILDYTAYPDRDYWVRELFVYVLYSGDLDFARRYWPQTVKLLDERYPALTNPNGTVLDNGYESILYAQQLRQAATLAEWLGDTFGGEYADHAPEWRERAERVAAATNEHLWDADPGAFVGTGAQRCHETYANAIATTGLFGGAANLAPAMTAPDRVDRIFGHLATYRRPWGYGGSDDGEACPFFDINTEDLVYGQANAYLANAAFRHNRPDLALDVLRRTYGWQLARDPGTLWEGYTTGGKTEGFFGTYFTSMTHGHMAGAAGALTGGLLGVAPSGVGFRTFDVVPHPGDVTWAEGRVPTPHGDIDVRWRQPTRGSATGGFRMTVASPNGTAARLGVPTFGQPVTVTVNGRTVWDGDRPTGAGAFRAHTDGHHVYLENVPSGRYHVVSRRR